MASTPEDIPDHPIIDKPWRYDIIRFDLHHDPENWRASFLDLWLRLDGNTRRLRFRQPRSIKIEEGFPSPTRGMVIRDISSWGWEDVAVQVADFEASHGAVTFYAKDVVEVGPDGECG